MDIRIGIVGCAGTGKSVFAEKIAATFNVPLLSSKDITGDILIRDGYDYASGIQVERFLSTPERQKEILTRTIAQQSVSSFVTDRTSVDLAAYAILEMEGPLNVKKYVEQCNQLSNVYTHLFFCHWMDGEIANNKKRTLDPWYQFSVHSVELQVAEMFGLCLTHMDEEDVDKRLSAVKKFIG